MFSMKGLAVVLLMVVSGTVLPFQLGTFNSRSEDTDEECDVDRVEFDNGNVHVYEQSAPYTAGSTVRVSCMTGFTLIGPSYMTCLADGSWNRSSTCRIQGCINCYNLPHGHVKFSGLLTPHYDAVLATCDDGYQITGSPYLTCVENATWSTGASCVLKDCGKNYTLENGVINFGDNDTTVGSKFAVKCDTGYKVDGDTYISCGLNGNWSGSSKCVIIDCGTAYSIENGHAFIIRGNTTYNHTAQVVCRWGFTVRGPIEIRCLANGTWSHTSCERRGSRHSAPIVRPGHCSEDEEDDDED